MTFFRIHAVPVVLVAGLCSACSGPTALDLSVVAGAWAGSVSQPDSVSEVEYPVLVVFVENGEAFASVDYPSLGCAGSWDLDQHDGDATIVVERVNEESDECVGGGQVTLSYFEGDDTISYVWDDDPGDDGGRSTATLTRD